MVRGRQDGLALIVVVIVILMAISSYYFSSISLVDVQVDKIEKKQALLKRAKRALLAYALSNGQVVDNIGRIGQLPCPDRVAAGNAGIQDNTNCGTDYANAIGYFPWMTLGLETTKDDSGNCLLYAVSPAYKNGTDVALNPDSFGHFRIADSTGAIIQGVAAEDRPVAVIIAPGVVLPNQVRVNNPLVPCGSYYADNLPNLLAAHLDDDGNTDNTAIGIGGNNVLDTFVQKYAGSDVAGNPLNDQLITITHREFWSNMEITITSPAFTNRMNDVTEAIALCFAQYGLNNTKHLPMPAPLDVNGGDYRRSVDYDDSGDFSVGYAGRLPYDVSQANTELPPTVPANENHIYDNLYCNNLVTTNLGETVDFEDMGGADNGMYRDLVTNWKDHFFYVVSNAYKPDGTVATCTAANCVEYAGARYAALVIYSG